MTVSTNRTLILWVFHQGVRQVSLHRFDCLITSDNYDAVGCSSLLAMIANDGFTNCGHSVHTVDFARREPAFSSSFERIVVIPNPFALTIVSQQSVKTSALHLRCCSEVALTC